MKQHKMAVKAKHPSRSTVVASRPPNRKSEAGKNARVRRRSGLRRDWRSSSEEEKCRPTNCPLHTSPCQLSNFARRAHVKPANTYPLDSSGRPCHRSGIPAAAVALVDPLLENGCSRCREHQRSCKDQLCKGGCVRSASPSIFGPHSAAAVGELRRSWKESMAINTCSAHKRAHIRCSLSLGTR